MNKIIVLLIMGLVYSCSSSKKINNQKDNDPIYYHYAGQINAGQLNLIKDYYNWKHLKILVIFFTPPQKDCYYNNYRFGENDNPKYAEFLYSMVNYENTLFLNVFSEGEKLKKSIDNIFLFDDKNDFLYHNFFNKKKSCFGTLVLNQEGYYIQYNDFVKTKQLDKFIENLKK